MDDPEHLPHRERQPLLIVGFLLLLMLGVSLLPASWLGVKKQVVQLPPIDLSNIGSNPEHDLDSDGTLSWKEFISSSLNLSEETVVDIKPDPRAIAALNDPNNLSSSFTKNLYIASVALKDQGITDPSVEEATMIQLLSKEAEKLQPVVYTEASLKIGSDSSKAALKVYGNAVASALKGMITEESIVQDLTGLTNFVQSENEGDLLPLVKNRERAKSALSKLLAITVPPVAVNIHIDVLNRVGGYVETIDNLSRAFDDPIRATLALDIYLERSIEALRFVPLLSAFFSERNVVFSSQENGYVFTAGYTTQ